MIQRSACLLLHSPVPWTVRECLVVGGDYLGCRGAAVPHCHFRRFAGARVGVRHGELAVVRLNRGLADGRRGPVGIEDGADLMKAGVEHVQKKDTKNTKPKTILPKRKSPGGFSLRRC